jgi:hypothetical protein
MTRVKAESANGHTDVTILARVLGNEEGTLSLSMAKHILTCQFSELDKSRMHELATRNQNDDLSESEKHELRAYAKAGTLLSILKSRARQVVRKNGPKRTSR